MVTCSPNLFNMTDNVQRSQLSRTPRHPMFHLHPVRFSRLVTYVARLGPRHLLSTDRPTAPIHNPSTVSTASEDEGGAGVSTAAEEDASRLFDEHHIPSWTPSLLLYAPIGLLVAICRMALWILGIAWDAPWFRNPSVVATYLRLLGVRCNWHRVDCLPAGRHVMVSNHVTAGDLQVLFQGLPQRYVHLITNAMPARVVSTRNLPCELRFATPEVYEQLRQQAATTSNVAGGSGNSEAGGTGRGSSEATSVHLFPEGGITNGRYGMMRFSRGFTHLLGPGDPVVPLALKVTTPWGIRTHTLNSSFLANLFWLSFCPWVQYDATILNPVTRGVDESRGAFAQRVQRLIADETGLVISNCNISAKKRIMQRSKMGKPA